MRCFLVCYSCKKGFTYSINENLCKNCGESIVDPKVKPLVFALNLCGVTTERSCEGHDNFEGGCHGFPWVTILDEKDLGKLDLMIAEYNFAIADRNDDFSQWKTGFNVRALKYWLFPVDDYKRVESLQRESKILAEFIVSRFGKLKVASN